MCSSLYAHFLLLTVDNIDNIYNFCKVPVGKPCKLAVFKPLCHLPFVACGSWQEQSNVMDFSFSCIPKDILDNNQILFFNFDKIFSNLKSCFHRGYATVYHASVVPKVGSAIHQINHFIIHCTHHLSSHWLKAYRLFTNLYLQISE